MKDITIFDSDITAKGKDRQRFYTQKTGIKNLEAMHQAFKDIHESEPIRIEYTKVVKQNKTYRAIEGEPIPLDSKNMMVYMTESNAIYKGTWDVYSVRSRELGRNPKTFANIYKQVQIINVREW